MLFFRLATQMDWSDNFKSADDVTVYLIANLQPPGPQNQKYINDADLPGEVVLCYGKHCITRLAGEFHFWIGDRLYASNHTLATLILQVADLYVRDFLS